jgi:excisionase family DNA binding protein
MLHEIEDRGSEPLHIHIAHIRGLIKVPRVAEYLDCSTHQVCVMLESGVLPSVRFCGSVRVDPYDLAKWLETHSNAPNTAYQVGRQPWDGGMRLKLASSKGGDPAEWPKDICVREYPPGKHAT